MDLEDPSVRRIWNDMLYIIRFAAGLIITLTRDFGRCIKCDEILCMADTSYRQEEQSCFILELR